MQKITLSDFSGGHKYRGRVPQDFGNGQWKNLVGFVLNEDGLPETQPAIQRVGSFPSGDYFHRVHPINHGNRTWLVAITRTGKIYWCEDAALTANYTTSNAVTWTQLTTAENYQYSTSSYPSKETIVDNPYARFLCDIALPAADYARVPSSTGNEHLDVEKDTENTSELGVFPGVLVSCRLDNKTTISTPQTLVVYLNTLSQTVKAIVFPHQRRIPTYTNELNGGVSTSSFINAVFLDGSEKIDYGTMKTWPFDMPSGYPQVKMHPFTYANVDGANLSGTGIIPRANVACPLPNTMLLGDIEWRISRKALPTVPVQQVLIDAEVGTTPKILEWPSEEGIFPDGRVIFNQGPNKIYLQNGSSTSVDAINPPGLNGRKVVKAGKSASPAPNTCTLEIGGTANLPTTAAAIQVTGVGPNFNGIYTSANFTIDNSGATKKITFIKSTGPATLPLKKRNGKVVFLNTGLGYDLEVQPSTYVAIPNDWETIRAVAEGTAELYALRDRLLARHFLNDANTAPKPNGIYFADSGLYEVDKFNPTYQFNVTPGGGRLVGLHALDSTVIALSVGGGSEDGVYRIRGNYFNATQGDRNAIRSELVKGGINVNSRAFQLKNGPSPSTVWAETSTVIFEDRLGGVYYTDGNRCDRLDRIGPGFTVSPAPSMAGTRDGLFVSKAVVYSDAIWGIECFNLVSSDGASASGAWTQLSLLTNLAVSTGTPASPNVPAGHFVIYRKDVGNVRYSLHAPVPPIPTNLVAGQQCLYFVVLGDADGQPVNQPDTIYSVGTGASGGNIYRILPRWVSSERGRIDNVPVAQFIVSPAVGGEDQNDRTNWVKMSATFSTPTTAGAAIIAAGCASTAQASFFAIARAPSSFPDAVAAETGSSDIATQVYNTYSGTTTLHEFITPVNIGQQKSVAGSIMFTGHLIFRSLSFWAGGKSPNNGKPS